MPYSLSNKGVTHGLILLCGLAGSPAAGMSAAQLAAALTPEPRQIDLQEGYYSPRGVSIPTRVPAGPEHEACRNVLRQGPALLGTEVDLRLVDAADGCRFSAGSAPVPPPMTEVELSPEAYALRITPGGIAARAASPVGLLYASQTLRQLCRLFAQQAQLPCLSIVDFPEFRLRGMYIEGGQERFGRIVEKDYLCRQIRRLSEFKMNTLIIECYNLFPLASLPDCADEGTLSVQDCRDIVAEAKRHHVTIIPSLQTLAQSWELVWNSEAGTPYRETTAPGQMCPSTPAIYPFIKNLYRDLLTLFDDSPLIGIGCSEIDMQWKGRYCPACQARVDAGETVRDLLLGHAEECIRLVGELAVELERPIRPLMWADEFYMYGPGKDWLGIERIPRDTVMGHWKYWRDYGGIEGLMRRGYDVLGVQAMYNHTFYLADLSAESPPKSWPAMEQTGALNITQMVQQAHEVGGERRQATGATQGQPVTGRPEFWGTATASFSKHRLRAFDSIWYGFILNGHCAWSHPERAFATYQTQFTRAFARHFYDCRTETAAEAIALCWQQLDGCKSQLELANQTLHDVVGVYDTQEAGYLGNCLLDAWRRCRELCSPSGEPTAGLQVIHEAAGDLQDRAAEAQALLTEQEGDVGRPDELADLQLAAEKIAAHAQRQALMIDTQQLLTRGPKLSPSEARAQAAEHANRWADHQARAQRIARRDAGLYRRGDPCGHAALLRDVGTILAHLRAIAAKPVPEPEDAGSAGQALLDERFEGLDPTRWIVRGEPKVADGRLHTNAPGGWGDHCGIVTREALHLHDDQALVIRTQLTPVKMGIDSQLITSATAAGSDAYRFAFYGPRDRFGVYTRSEGELQGPWVDKSAGWHLRATSAPVQEGQTYSIEVEITRRTFRVIVRAADDGPWDMPLWDTSDIPMDPLDETRVLLGDVEPEGSVASSRWGPVTIHREPRGS